MKVSMEVTVASVSGYTDDQRRDGAVFTVETSDSMRGSGEIRVVTETGQTIRLRVDRAEADELAAAFAAMAAAIHGQP